MRRDRRWGAAALVAVAACTPTTSGPPTPTPTTTTTVSPSVAATPAPAPTTPTATGSTSTVPPADAPYPAATWATGDWPDGVDGAAIEAAAAEAMGEGLGPRVRGFAVVHRGRLVHESHSPSLMDGPDTRYPSWSIAKSVTSALVGVLVGQGRLDLDAPAPVAAWHVDGADPRAAITLEDLLGMSSGLEWDNAERPGSDLARLHTAPDAAAVAAASPVVADPGTTFNYSNGDTILVDRVLADLVGDGEALEDFLRAELLEPIGIGGMDLRFDAAGTWRGDAYADATVTDLARLGLLYLRDGTWDGRRVLPEGWVDRTATPTRANREYGLHWWLDPQRPGVLYAIGVDGQVIGVVPEHDLVFVQTATDSARSLELSDLLLAAFDAAG